jgi:MFS family permease
MSEEDRAGANLPRPPIVGSGGDGSPREANTVLRPGPARRMTFREVMSVGGRSTLGLIFGLLLVDSIDNAMFTVFAPEIRESLGMTSAQIAVVGALAGVMVSLGALPIGLLGDRRRRTGIAGVCTLVWAAAAASLTLVHTFVQVVIARIVAGIGRANEGPIQISILTDAYPPDGRGRVLGVHRAAQPLGIVAGPVLAAVFAAVVPAGHESWRWAFAFLACCGVLLGLATLRLREPVRGRLEREVPPGRRSLPDPDTTLVSPRAAFARLTKIRTFSFVMVALGAFGLCVIAVPIYLTLILEDQLGQDVGARGLIGAVCAVGGLAGAAVGGVFSDRLFRRSPTGSLYLASAALAALGIGFAVQAYSPDVTTFVVVGVLTQGMTFAGLVPLSLVVAAVTPPQIRSTAFALVGVYLAFVGGLGGALVTGLVEQAWGPQAAVAVVASSASVVAGLVLASGSGHLLGDIAAQAGPGDA